MREPADPEESARERLNALAREVLGGDPMLSPRDTPPRDGTDPSAAREPSIQPARILAIGPSADALRGPGVSSAPRRSLSRARTQIGLMPPEARRDTAEDGRPRSGHPHSAAFVQSEQRFTTEAPQKRFFDPLAPSDQAVAGAGGPSRAVVLLPPPSPVEAPRAEREPWAAPDEASNVDVPRIALGRYEVLCRIARGGMGTVYLCRVTGEGGFRRLFALKVLRRHLSRDPAAAELFLREARIVARIYDPHVVGIHDVGMHGAQPYLVMDYVEGASFHDLWRRHPTERPPRLVVPIILDTLSGLHAAHTQLDDDGTPLGLVHCDVSPHNILVGIDGSSRLSDFGIAKAVASTALRADVGAHGKPGYLSPEQVKKSHVDQRADLFSLGIVLWTALTGERLFDGETVQQTLANVLGKPVPPPSTVGRRPPAALDAICLRALARDPAERYPTALEMMRDLREVALAEGLLAPPSEVARWVADTFGPELAARRRMLIDGAEDAYPKGPASGEDAASGMPRLDRERGDLRRAFVGGPSPGEVSETLPLGLVSGRLHAVLVVAVVASVLTVVVALLWPERIARLFRVEVPASASRSRAPSASAAPPAPAAPRSADREEGREVGTVRASP
jgi:serine/threonine-protein kinase